MTYFPVRRAVKGLPVREIGRLWVDLGSCRRSQRIFVAVSPEHWDSRTAPAPAPVRNALSATPLPLMRGRRCRRGWPGAAGGTVRPPAGSRCPQCTGAPRRRSAPAGFRSVLSGSAQFTKIAPTGPPRPPARTTRAAGCSSPRAGRASAATQEAFSSIRMPRDSKVPGKCRCPENSVSSCSPFSQSGTDVVRSP